MSLCTVVKCPLSNRLYIVIPLFRNERFKILIIMWAEEMSAQRLDGAYH